MASDSMQVASLGRPFSLGMLYDVRKDEMLPGLKLWSDETLQEKTTKHAQPFSAFKIAASDTIESRSSLLNVEASLKASFLGGLIEVEGSAKYLSDKKKFKNQSRVTCQYNATTIFKELTVTSLETMNTQQTEIIKNSTATHIVTGILYGANAFFVFDSEKLDSSSVQDIQGGMEAVIKKIPSFDVKGKVDIKLTDEEKDLTNKFSCKFYGDFILKNNPANFEEAVNTYVKLPQLLGEDGEDSVPLKIWMMPLKMFVPEAAELTSELSLGLVRKVQNAMEDLREMRMRCNDSQVDQVVENFPQIRKDFIRFQNLCDYYERNLCQTFAKKLPLVREGEEDESSLKELFEDRDKSPFRYEKLSQWLEHKEREINVIRFCVDTMTEAKVVCSQSDLDREVLAPGVDHALCFVFTSLESDDSYLDQMAEYLDSKKIASTNDDLWYYSDEVMTKLREKAEIIQNLSKALKGDKRFRFLVASIHDENYKGATIYHYKEGRRVDDDFSKPDIPAVKEITDKSDLIWYSTDLTLDPNTAHSYLILSEGNKKATSGEWQDYADHPDRFDFQRQALCREGLTGRHYWEAELSTGPDNSVYVSAAYKEIKRKGESQTFFGYNPISWSFGIETIFTFAILGAWHNGLKYETHVPSEGCSRIGVYLDCPGGTLSFYRVSSNTLTHLYTFENKFTEPVYPGVWAYHHGNYVYLNPTQ